MPNTAKHLNKPTHVTKGSVFDDLGLAPCEVAEARIKSDLWRDLVAHIAPLQLTQKELAKKLDVHQPDVSNLITGKLSKFSVETLIRYAVKLGLGFEAKFTGPKPQKRAAQSSSAVKRSRHTKALAGAGA